MGIGNLRWYTYNIADACFVVGVIALVFAMLFLIDDQAKDEARETTAESGTDAKGGVTRPS